MESSQLIAHEESGDHEERRGQRKNIGARDSNTPAPTSSGALVMDVSVSARLGCRQHGRRRSTASSIRRAPGGVLKIEKRAARATTKRKEVAPRRRRVSACFVRISLESDDESRVRLAAENRDGRGSRRREEDAPRPDDYVEHGPDATTLTTSVFTFRGKNAEQRDENRFREATRELSRRDGQKRSGSVARRMNRREIRD